MDMIICRHSYLQRESPIMKHVHILITDDASPEQTVLQLPDALLPIVHLTAERSADDAITGQIRSILLSAGMPPHLKGYHY